MKRFMPLMFVPFVAVAACGDDDGGNTTPDADATSPSETRDTTTQEVGPGISPITGVNTNVTVTEPTRNAACSNDEFFTGTGAKYPWGGFTMGDTTYTCNACPNGDPQLAGAWRAFEFDEEDDLEDYDKPDPSDYAEVITIDGNTFKYEIFDSAGSPKDIVARGYYACLQQPEHPNKHYLWVVTEGQGTGQWYSTGGSFGSDVILIMQNDWRAYWFNDIRTTNAEKPKGDDEKPYCKVGTSKNGKDCVNPFE